MFSTSVQEKTKGPSFALLRKPFNCRLFRFPSLWQVFRTVPCFAEIDKNHAHETKHPKAAFAKFGQEFDENPKNQFLKIPPNSCLNTRLFDETPCKYIYIYIHFFKKKSETISGSNIHQKTMITDSLN